MKTVKETTHVHYYEMLSAPSALPSELPEGLSITELKDPTVDFYRYLYHGVGGPWRWTSRKLLSDSQLLKSIRAPDTKVSVLYKDGNPAGFADVQTQGKDSEIQFFGIFPDYYGQKLGRLFLSRVVARAWMRPELKRLWLHTCDLDHPVARRTYEEQGFRCYKTEKETGSIITQPV